MKKIKNWKAIVVCLICIVGGLPKAWGAKYPSFEEALSLAAQKISQSAALPPSAKMAVVGFTESTSHQRWGLSNVIEDDLTGFLILQKPGRVVAKNHIDTVLHELKITREELFDRNYQKRFGRLVSADLLVCGSYWVDKRYVVINISVVDIESGLAFFSHRVKIRKSQIPKQLLQTGGKK